MYISSQKQITPPALLAGGRARPDERSGGEDRAGAPSGHCQQAKWAQQVLPRKRRRRVTNVESAVVADEALACAPWGQSQPKAPQSAGLGASPWTNDQNCIRSSNEKDKRGTALLHDSEREAGGDTA